MGKIISATIGLVFLTTPVEAEIITYKSWMYRMHSNLCFGSR